MDDSVIDLCDSDDDDDKKKKKKVVYESDSSSSSSDEELWNAGGFLKGTSSDPTLDKNNIKSKRKGNYFKEVKGDTDKKKKEGITTKKKNVKRTKREYKETFGNEFGDSPIVSLELDNGCDDSDSSSGMDGGNKKFGSGTRKFGQAKKKQNSMSKRKKSDIDTDDNSSSDEDSSPKNKLFGAPNKKQSNNNTLKKESSPIKKKSRMDSPAGNKKKNNEVECIEIDLDSSSDDSDEVMNKKQPAKKSIPSMKNNSHDNSDDDEMSQSSNSTIPLSEDQKSDAMKKHTKQQQQQLLHSKKKGGRVSFNNNDSIEVFDNDDDSDNGAVSDFDFGNGGGFDDDDDDNDEPPDKKKSIKSVKQQKPRLSADVELLEIDSSDDESDNDSTSSTELFKEKKKKPFKKKKKPASLKTSESETKSKTSNDDWDRGMKSKLLTPRAPSFSPPTTTPTQGLYKRTVPIPPIPAMSASLVKEIGGKLYPDLRPNFIIALTSHAKELRNNSYQRASFDSALRSIVVISLHMRPLRSAEAARRLKGVGSVFYDLLKESVKGSKGKGITITNGKFSCVATAALVALLELEEANSSVASANGISYPMEDVIRKINQLLCSRSNAALNQSTETYLNASNLDPGYGQLKKLASTNATVEYGGPFIKERKKKNACPSGVVFELLDSGRELATKLRIEARNPVEPGPLRQLPHDTVEEQYGNVTMSMDFREGGGGGKSLHGICDKLDTHGLPYVVRELKIADYLFFVGDKLAPILIERKTAEDVASSLYDGRWERQKRAMRKAQYILGGGPDRRCEICYIIEGDASKKTVHGGNVGRRNWQQTVEDVERAIASLPVHGFSVMKTKGHLDTVCKLAKVAEDVSWKAKNGSTDATFTYQQFLSRVKALDDKYGDAPTDPRHMNPAPPVPDTDDTPEATFGEEDSPFYEPSQDGDAAESKQEAKKPAKKPASKPPPTQETNSQEHAQLKKLSIAQLKERCKERDEKIGGKKDDLISRLLKPRKPEILISRARRKEYVPKVPSSNAALMVALLLHHVPGTQGMTKERLMLLAEGTGVSKESMSGDGGFYDGWSGMSQLQTGDPALVRKEKGHRYSLTTQPPETSGRAVAHALHILAHREGLCTSVTPLTIHNLYDRTT